jgi:O-antigen/teichoic acid export membrane protein
MKNRYLAVVVVVVVVVVVIHILIYLYLFHLNFYSPMFKTKHFKNIVVQSLLFTIKGTNEYLAISKSEKKNYV